jgi:DHA2 family multidrug resistance protein
LLDRINTITGGLMAKGHDQVTAHKEALKVLNGTISVRSSVMSFNNIFRVVAFAFLFSLPLLLLLGKGSSKAAGPSMDC